MSDWSIRVGMFVWGMGDTWRNGRCAPISFSTRVLNQCAETWFLFSYVIKIIRKIMITSTVSPVLKVGLRFLGMWSNDSRSVIHWLSFMSSMVILQYFQYLYIFDHLKISELSNLVDGLIVTLDYSLTLFKMISLWLHRR